MDGVPSKQCLDSLSVLNGAAHTEVRLLNSLEVLHALEDGSGIYGVRDA